MESKELTKEEKQAQAEAARKEAAKPMTMGEVMQLKPVPGKGGQRALPKPSRAQLIQRYDNAISELQMVSNGQQQTIQGMLQNLQRTTAVIKQLSDKLEESQVSVAALHNVLKGKNIVKEDELKAEAERVVELENERRDAELDKRAGLRDKGPDAVVEKGDIVIISYEGKLYGASEPFAGGIGNRVLLPVGQGLMVPGFEDQLIGTAAGQTGVIDIQFPAEYREDLALQKAQFKVTVHKIKVPMKKTKPAEAEKKEENSESANQA